MKCSFIEPDDECRPTEEMPVVVYLHGNSSSRLEGQRMVDHLLKHDINVFLFDFAGSGKREGEFISLGYHESRDVGIIIDLSPEAICSKILTHLCLTFCRSHGLFHRASALKPEAVT